MLLLAYVYIVVSSFGNSSSSSHSTTRAVGQKELSSRTGETSDEGAGATTKSSVLAEGSTPPGQSGTAAINPESRTRSGKSGGETAAWLTLFLIVALGLGWYFGWDTLFPRMQKIEEGYVGREEMFASAMPMTKDYPWFGTGPGTFGTVFQLYRYSDDVFWAEQLHNDWLETRITFGWLGLGLVLAALAVVLMRWFFSGGMRTNRRFLVLLWISLAGCLITAWFDFPFQVHSTLFLFLLICAILFNFGRQAGPSRR
jgi:hypothetical protein